MVTEFYQQLISHFISEDASCTGDTGGPMVAKPPAGSSGGNYLYGIVSFGSSGCSGRSTGAYTRLDSFVQWIKDKIDA